MNVNVAVFVLPPLLLPYGEDRTRALRSECKIDQIDFKDCISISYLPSHLMEEISPYLEALSANTVSFQFTWNSQKDINNLDINALIQPTE